MSSPTRKAARCFGCWSSILVPAIFRAGVRGYLEAHQFANAETTDLWKAMGDASGQPIPEVMDRWIFHPGYPLVMVEAEGTGETVRFTQLPFRYLGDDGDSAVTWRIPVTYRARVQGEELRGRILLSTPEDRVTLPAAPDWVVANEGGHGFYRVRYGPDLLTALLRAPTEKMTAVERFNLLNDTWAATLAGMLPVTDFLNLTAHLKGETDRHAWVPLLASFGFLARVVPRDLRPHLERLVRNRLGDVAARLGWSSGEAEDDLVRELRGEILRTMGTLGNDPDVQREARRRHAAEPGTATLRPQRAHGRHFDRGAHRGSNGIRRVPAPFQGGRDTADGAAISPCAGRIPPTRFDPADPGTEHQWSGADTGCAVPGPGPAHGSAQPRTRLGVRQRPLGRDGETLSVPDRSTARVRGHLRSSDAGTRDRTCGSFSPRVAYRSEARPSSNLSNSCVSQSPFGRVKWTDWPLPSPNSERAKDAVPTTVRRARAACRPRHLGAV